MAEPLKYDVFVSYSAKDKPWASEFVDALQGEGVRAWLDREKLAPGERWDDQIEAALRESRVVVFLVTPDSVNSPWTSFELGAAMGDNKKIVPILTEHVERHQIPSHLQRLGVIKESSPRIAGKRVAELAKAGRRAG